eukprot:gnl/MRDRNA2_/MRDRNA2_101217_c0_seq1.p1 gnl/MRDRNA2_/MRDRNA2_101217_c0~~gnl/MRDRNA2_/MRDRNA2_101217_c0_seq1.p1  ORF type:complete len:382 (+),score=107.51 gnl/MRDRNA2_/MRDRNA2_101217_c0_seq1:85-1230(+)
MARASFRPGDPSQAAAPGGGLGGLGQTVKAARASFRPGDPNQRAAPQGAPPEKKKSVIPGAEGTQKRASQVDQKSLIENKKELAPELQRAIAAELQIGLETIQNTVQVEIFDVIEEIQTQIQNLSKRFDKWREQDLDSGGKDGKDGKLGETASLKVEVHNFKDLTKSIQDDVGKIQKALESYSQESKRVEHVVRKLEYRGERAIANSRREEASMVPSSPGSPGAKKERILQLLQADLKREMDRERKLEEKVDGLAQKMEEQGIIVASKKPKEGDSKAEDTKDTNARGSPDSANPKAKAAPGGPGPRAAKKEDEEHFTRLDNEVQAVKKAITGLRKDLKTETEERIAKGEELSKAIGELKGGDAGKDGKPAAGKASLQVGFK